jgi:hypothetical protein
MSAFINRGLRLSGASHQRDLVRYRLRTKSNQYATGVVRSEKTREKMRAAQRMSKSGSYM